MQKTSTTNGRGVTIKLYQGLLFEMNLPDLSQLLPILRKLLLGRRITTMKHLAIREHTDKLLFETCEEYHISCCELRILPAPLLATVISNYFILLLPGVLHCKKAFVILTFAFVTRVATVDQNSPLWQPAMGSKTHMEYRKS